MGLTAFMGTLLTAELMQQVVDGNEKKKNNLGKV